MRGRKREAVTRFLHRVAGAVTDGDAPDRELLRRFVNARDDGAFAALLRRHGPMVLGVCRRMLGDPCDAEDAFQATFLVLARKAGSLWQPERVANWLYGVACRTAVRARADRARRRAHERRVAAMAEAVEPARTGGAELRGILDEELGRLPEKYRAPLVLCYLEGRSYPEAARALGWPEGTVAGRLARARTLLRGRLARRGLAPAVGTFAGLSDGHAASAAVPPDLAEQTVRAALDSATGKATVAGVVSARVVSLTEGVLRTMWVNKMKTMMLASLGLLVLAGGAGVWLHQAVAAHPAPGEVVRQSVVPFAGAPKQEPVKGGVKGQLQGAWGAVSGETVGDEKFTAEQLRPLRLGFKGDMVTFRLKEEELKGKYRLIEGQMEAVGLKIIEFDGGEGKRLLALYELKGDTLRLCFGNYNATPPTGFDSRGTTVLVMKKRKTS